MERHEQSAQTVDLTQTTIVQILEHTMNWTKDQEPAEKSIRKDQNC